MRKLFAIFLLCGLILFFGALVFAGPIGGGGSGATSVTGTANQVIANPTTGAVILSTPQNIHTGATPTFGGLTLTPGPITITGGTVTANAPLLDLTQTWNNAGATFTGLKSNITDTASDAASLLADLQVGGVSKWKVNKTGIVTQTNQLALPAGTATNLGLQIGPDSNTGVFVESTTNRSLGINHRGVKYSITNLGLIFPSDKGILWSPSAETNSDVIAPQLSLYFDDSNILAQRNWTSAQTSRLYGTFTDAANYERMALSTQIGTGVTIAAERAGTGAANLGITLTPAGTGNVTVTSGSVVTPAVTVGASGTAITQMRVYTPTLDPASVAAAATAEQTYTVTGLATTDKVIVNKPTMTAGCVIGNARVSAADTLAITWGNVQVASACDPPSEVYSIIAIRS